MRFDIRLLPRLILAWVGMALMTILLAPAIIVASMIPGSGYSTYRMGRAWNWAVAKFMGMRFSLTGAEKVVPGASYIITPNHQSFADILALFVCLPTPFRWVIKRELLKIPLFGWALGATGAICLDRSDSDRSVKSLQESTRQIAGRLVGIDLSRRNPNSGRSSSSLQEGGVHDGCPDGDFDSSGHLQRGFQDYAEEELSIQARPRHSDHR